MGKEELTLKEEKFLKEAAEIAKNMPELDKPKEKGKSKNGEK